MSSVPNCPKCNVPTFWVDNGKAIGAYYYCRTCKKEPDEWKKALAATPVGVDLAALGRTGVLFSPSNNSYGVFFTSRGYDEPTWDATEGVYYIKPIPHQGSAQGVAGLCKDLNSTVGPLPDIGAFKSSKKGGWVCINEPDLNFFRSCYGLPTYANSQYYQGHPAPHASQPLVSSTPMIKYFLYYGYQAPVWEQSKYCYYAHPSNGAVDAQGLIADLSRLGIYSFTSTDLPDSVVMSEHAYNRIRAHWGLPAVALVVQQAAMPAPTVPSKP